MHRQFINQNGSSHAVASCPVEASDMFIWGLILQCEIPLSKDCIRSVYVLLTTVPLTPSLATDTYNFNLSLIFFCFNIFVSVIHDIIISMWLIRNVLFSSSLPRDLRYCILASLIFLFQKS